jgi:hypothetical protein
MNDTVYWSTSITITDEGENNYKLLKATSENLVFYDENVDRASRKTKLLYILGKNGIRSLK